MGLFSFTQEIAIDLGTANTVIIHNDKIVVDEPSVVALDKRTDKLLAVGEKARLMYEKTHENIRTIRPLRDGVIADFYAAEQMIRGMVKMVSSKSHWFSPSLRMVIGIPSGSTEVEIRAVRDSSEHAGGRDVYMIYEPMAAAIGIGLDVLAPEGNMIVDIGGGTTEIAVISLGGIVSNNSIRVAGDDLTSDIQEYMGRQHNVKVGERTAEMIKINVGSALTELDNPPEDYVVHGPNRMTALPMEVPVSYQEIAHGIEKSISKIPRTLCRHRAQRYLAGRRRCPAERLGQTVDRQDRYPLPHCRRSPARCGQRHGRGFEEYRPVLVPHPIRADDERAGLSRPGMTSIETSYRGRKSLCNSLLVDKRGNNAQFDRFFVAT